jgi:hypothetical protein
MRSLVLITLVACTSSHPPPVDRTACSECHTLPVAADPPLPSASACISVDNPHHGSATSGTQCAECHGTLAWCPAEATHTDFALVGDHAGWDCADCHVAVTYEPAAMVTDPKQITCISCHWHSADRTDPFHLGKGDYEYGAATCVASGCHEPRRQ